MPDQHPSHPVRPIPWRWRLANPSLPGLGLAWLLILGGDRTETLRGAPAGFAGAVLRSMAAESIHGRTLFPRYAREPIPSTTCPFRFRTLDGLTIAAAIRCLLLIPN